MQRLQSQLQFSSGSGAAAASNLLQFSELSNFSSGSAGIEIEDQRKAATSSSSRSSATSEVQVLVLNGVAADGEGAAEEGTAEAAEDEGWSVASRPAALRRARP